MPLDCGNFKPEREVDFSDEEEFVTLLQNITMKKDKTENRHLLIFAESNKKILCAG